MSELNLTVVRNLDHWKYPTLKITYLIISIRGHPLLRIIVDIQCEILIRDLDSCPLTKVCVRLKLEPLDSMAH